MTFGLCVLFYLFLKRKQLFDKFEAAGNRTPKYIPSMKYPGVAFPFMWWLEGMPTHLSFLIYFLQVRKIAICTERDLHVELCLLWKWNRSSKCTLRHIWHSRQSLCKCANIDLLLLVIGYQNDRQLPKISMFLLSSSMMHWLPTQVWLQASTIGCFRHSVKTLFFAKAFPDL